ncbi:hypothetical protein [Moheibacter sediminis]|uniref:hypothetical protein n=1 Tax=Moheibacter sediminis TaxID=1434700 RepID=UPI0013566F5B|nr:hypothetical protein [Moheibacter sediminis]
MVERTKLVAENPLSNKVTDFNEITISPLDNFSIFYKITAQEIIITAFWDSRTDPKDF